MNLVSVSIRSFFICNISNSTKPETDMATTTITIGRRHPAAAPRMKRSRSPHQQQMRFFTVMFVTLALALFGTLIYLVNR